MLPSITYRILCIGLIAGGLLLLGSTASQAQGLDDVEVHYGVKGGVALSDIQSDQTGGSGRRQGFTGGGFVSVGLPESFSVQGEVLYVRRGDKQEINQENNIATSVIKLDYIDIPVLVRIEAPLLGQASMFPYLGPILSIEVNEDASQLLPLVNDDVREQVAERLEEGSLGKSTTFSFAFGVDFTIQGPSFDVLLDFRLTRSLSDIGDELIEVDLPRTPTRAIGFSNAVNNTIMVTAGVRF